MQYLILFREPDGRQDEHSPEEIAAHRRNWQAWMQPLVEQQQLEGGKPLSLEGRVIKDGQISKGPHTVGTEIVGGFLLVNFPDLEAATTTMKACPIVEFGGYIEIRPVK